MPQANSATLIVVSDAGRARFLSRKSSSTKLTEMEDMISPEAHIPARDLTSDRQGRSFSSGGSGNSAMGQQTDPHETIAKRFAALIVERARALADGNGFSHVVLMAPPHMLGHLRAHVKDTPFAKIVTDVGKDLIKSSLDDIAAHLPA